MLIFVRSNQQQYTSRRIVFISQQEQLIHAVKFVNVDTGQITSLCLTYGRITNNFSNGLINRILLVVVQFFVGTQKCICLQNFSHEIVLVRIYRVVAGLLPGQSAIP